jgi:hypothetical protein
MRSILKFISACILLQLVTIDGRAQLHPMEALGRSIFESFRQANFDAFYRNSIFSLDENSFKLFLGNIRNKSLQDELIVLHKQNFPPNTTFSEKWNIAFQHQWRKELRHLARYTPAMVRDQAFTPILKEAKEYGIKWTTTQLLAIEVLIPASWKNGRFQLKGDLDLDNNTSNDRILYLDRNLDYRITLDKLTYSKAFMIGMAIEDSDQSYETGILGNGSGQSDILVRFSTNTPSQLFYFCPDQEGAGGPITVKDFDDLNKPNQRTDILLTFSYGQPARAYQILIKQALNSSNGAILTERPQFLGEVPLPRGLSFPQYLR